MGESDLLRRGGEEGPDLEREEGEWPMLRSPAAGGGGGGHPGRATLAGVGAGGFADLGVGREGKAEDGMGVWKGWGKYRAREFMGTTFFRWVWCGCGGAAGIVALAWQGRNRRPAGFGLSWAGRGLAVR
jgi:hypothetical protein